MFAVGWGANQFSSMLIVYRHSLGIGPGAVAGLFGIYAAALVPGLLVGGPLSDRFGRRALVLPFVALSPLATLILAADPRSLGAIAIGRALGGLCSGTVFGAGTAWVQDLSRGDAASARRTALSLSAGFGLGPVVAALLAQWAPAPLVVPYLPHIVLGAAAVLVLWPVPGRSGAVSAADGAEVTAVADSGGGTRDQGRGSGRGRNRGGWPPAGVRTARFWLLVAPAGPAVFGTISLAMIVLPEETGMSPGATALLTVLAFTAGIGIQPLARRMEDQRPRSAVLSGLAAAVVGSGIGAAAVAAGTGPALSDLAAIFLGLAYGLCLVSGLRQAEDVAGARDRGAVIACYYVLAYVGFAAPYAADALNTVFGQAGTFGALGALTAAAAVLIAVSGVFLTAPRPMAAASARAWPIKSARG
jgi:MFS family permease